MCSIHLDAARSLAAKGIDKDAFMLFIWLEWTCSAVLGLVTGPALGYRLTPRLWSPYCFSDGSVFGAGMRCKRATATFGRISRCVFANCHLSVQP